ncbi:hypothetical protein GCM10011512_25060 [Tersicoccus solisilvae]|uniref:Lipoyl-binding domain-containing protein n=1 Tax=Tersicoccus solisilvae TaxID=1882339 RepID=A0ABQ1PH31_9MICC|nr:hypothetical protein [Tersicoccus solisilvae]GGC97048.1 hypothetical protein GCM10011512_25060 [Tersicoccus solisilvae]
MSADWVVACRNQPEPENLVAAVAAVAGDRFVRESAEGLLLEVATAEDGPADVVVELPRLIRVGAEPGRVLAGATITELGPPADGTAGPAGFPSLSPTAEPVWWVEVHAVSPAGRPVAERLALIIGGAFGGHVAGPPPGPADSSDAPGGDR